MGNFLSSFSTSNDHRQYLNNLPDLVYNHILKNLDLDDLWNSRLISKKFHSIIKSYDINELSFIDYRSHHSDNWFTTTRPPRPEYQLPLFKLDLLHHPYNNLLNLEYLRIQNDFSNLPYFRFNELNRFVKLQILEIERMDLVFNDLLQLPDLKALSIYLLGNELKGGSLAIDTPNLHSLAIRKNYNKHTQFIPNRIYDIPIDNDLIGNELKFNHPLSVKYLRIDDYEKDALIFTNLECLEIYFGQEGSLEPLDLFKFNRLKIFRINDCSLRDELKNLFRSKKNNLEFVIEGVKIKEINKIDEYNSKAMRLGFQLKNYDELEDDLHFFKYADRCDASRLISAANQLTGLFTKFTNIQEIDIQLRLDGSRLTRFIKGCPSLLNLRIENSSLNQQFYDQLPPAIKSLSYLYIHEEGRDLNLDFKFLMKMPYLRVLYTNQDVLIGDQLNLNNFKRLQIFRFMINNRIIEIGKEDRDRYHVNNSKKIGLPDRDYVDYNKIVNWSSWLRNKRS